MYDVVLAKWRYNNLVLVDTVDSEHAPIEDHSMTPAWPDNSLLNAHISPSFLRQLSPVYIYQVTDQSLN